MRSHSELGARGNGRAPEARPRRRILSPARRLSLAYSIAIWGAIALLAWLDAYHNPIQVETRQAFIGVVIAGIGAVFTWLADKAVTVAVTLAQAAVMIGTAIAHFARLVAGVFVRSWSFLGNLWTDVLRPFVGWAWQQVERLAAWLKDTLGPVLKFLDKVRTEIDRIYQRWLRPIFDTIEITRRILQLLAFLRIQWARELDAKLADLEARLLAPVRDLYRLVNLASEWVNRVITLDGLFQRLTLIRSMIRDAGLVFATQHNARIGGLTEEEIRRIRTGGDAAAPAAVTGEIREALRTDAGELAPYVLAGSEEMRAYLRATL
jgi:hypothetical protein